MEPDQKRFLAVVARKTGLVLDPEVLDARDVATLAYDAAKAAARFAKAKGAHDELIAAAHRAQAAPDRAGWFGVDDVDGLARLLMAVRDEGVPGPDPMVEAQALDAYELARARFAHGFVRAVAEAVGRPSATPPPSG